MGNTGSLHASGWARLTGKRLAPLDQLTGEPTRDLSKSPTRLDLLVIGVAQIIGAGIFIISGVGIKIAGPGVILSFLVAGLACTLAALTLTPTPSSGKCPVFLPPRHYFHLIVARVETILITEEIFF